MGMSATQARFLCLTARKSNVEFNGQQINQQRTTLSNESANYYSELCNIQVPTPPSVDDFTKVSYTFNDGALTNTITSMIAKGNGMYSISYIQKWQDDYSIVAAASNVINRAGNDQYYVGTNLLRTLGEETQQVVSRTVVKDGISYPVNKDNNGFYYTKIEDATRNVELQSNELNKLKFVKYIENQDPVIVDATKATIENVVDGDNKLIGYNLVESDSSNIIKVYNSDGELEGYTSSQYIRNNTLFLDELYKNVGFDQVMFNKALNDTFPENKDFYVCNQDALDLLKVTHCLLSDFGEIFVDLNQSNYRDQNCDVISTCNNSNITYYRVEHYDNPVKYYLDSDDVDSITELKTIDEDVIALEKEYKALLNKKYNGGEDTDWFVRYVKDSVTGAEIPYFYKKLEVENAHYGENDYALNSVKCFSLGSATETKEILNQLGVVAKDSSGRYVSITLIEENIEYETELDAKGNSVVKRDENGNPIPKKDDDGNVIKSTSQITYDLTTNTITDEDAYNEAMNEYNYQQHQYDKKIQDINSKLEIVQQQDKNLELNLKQLDTEENAINTEMEAVKKVISKNVEQSFKTFEA